MDFEYSHVLSRFGIDITNGKAGNMLEIGILEPSIVKKNALQCAVEAACTILSIDYVIQMPQEETEKERSKRIQKELIERKKAEKKWKEFITSKRKELF